MREIGVFVSARSSYMLTNTAPGICPPSKKVLLGGYRASMTRMEGSERCIASHSVLECASRCTYSIAASCTFVGNSSSMSTLS